MTGGEPLLRRNLPDLAAPVGVARHARPVTIDQCHPANPPRYRAETGRVSRINVSLDSLKPDRFAKICGRDSYEKVIAGLLAARKKASHRSRSTWWR